MWPLLFQNLTDSTCEIRSFRARGTTHLNECKVQFIDVCLLLPHGCLVRCHFDGDTNDKIADP